MGAVMATASKTYRALGLIAGLVLGVSRPAQALFVDAAVSPGTVVPVGTAITLTMTLTAETPYNYGLGNLEADPSMRFSGCASPRILDGWYSVYPDNPMLVTPGTPSATSLDFDKGYYIPLPSSRWVQWSFTATRTGTVTFSIVAADEEHGVYEGCADPSPSTCYFPGLPNPDPTTACGFATVTITSTLTGRLNARSIGTGGVRPAGQAYVEDPVEVVMSVTNTGTAPMSVRAAMTSTEDSETTVLLASGAVPAFPVPLAGGASAMLTWTYSVTAASPAGIAEFWGDAEGTLAWAAPLSVVPAPIALTVSVWVDPDGAGPLPAAPASQGSFMADDEVWVVATLTNTSGVAFDVDPRIVVGDSDTNLVPDFSTVGGRIPAAPQTLSGSTSRMFTWKYEVDRNDYYQLTCFFMFYDMMWSVGVRGVAQSAYLPMNQVGFSVTPEIPPVVEIGTAFSATLWVANLTGRPVILDGSATVFLQTAGGPNVTITAIPPAGSRTFNAAGQSLPFVYTVMATTVGAQAWDGGIAYAELGYPGYYGCIGMTAPASTQVVAPSPLVPTLTSSTTVVNAQTPYGLTLAVFNSSTCQATLTGLEDIYGLNERPVPASNLSVRASADCPTLPCVIAPSSTVTFTWSVTPYGCGDEDWSGTMTGDWDAACLFPTGFSRPYHSNRVLVRQQASLFDPGSVTWALSPTSVVEGGTFQVVCTVAPGGQNDIKEFNLEIIPHVSSTMAWTDVVSQIGPGPTIPEPLPGCGVCVNNVCWDKGQSFTWVFRADAKGDAVGRVWFTFTASGKDPFDATPVQSVTNTGTVRILKPSVITVSALVQSEPASCAGDVQLVVEVVGDTSVYVSSLGGDPSSPGFVAFTATPSAGDILRPGVTFYDWLYTPAQAGCVSFTLSAVGVEQTGGSIVYAAATTADTRCFTAPVLGGSYLVFLPAPTAGSGTPLQVRLTVTNGGQVRADNVWIQTWSVTGTAACGGRPARVPLLTGTGYADTAAGLSGCGNSASFDWFFTTTPGGEGSLEFAVTVTGIRSDTGGPLSRSDRFCITVWPAVYATIVSAPAYVVQGRNFDVGLLVTNGSSVTMRVTPGFPVVTSASGGLVELAPGPGVVNVLPFSTGSLTARMSALASAPAGADKLLLSGGSFTAADVSGKSPVAVPVIPGPAFAVTVLPNKMVFEIGENPWHPLRGPLPVTFVAPDGGRLTIKAYNLAGELVRTLLDERNASLQGTVLWDGRNESGQPVAAGIYLLRFEGSGLKVTKKLAVVK
mgnify:CR=1 FL=1